MMKFLLPFFSMTVLLLSGSRYDRSNDIGDTAITKWQYDKSGAVSITYDDGIRTQFSSALPIMRDLHLPGTFFIITGPIKGSAHQGKFVGRPVQQIIDESARVRTNDENFFERASAANYLGFKGAIGYYDRSAALFKSGKKKDAFLTLDTLYLKVSKGQLSKGVDTSMEIANEVGLTWADVKKIADEGYEFASHSVTHAQLPVLDIPNIEYELEKSKADILQNLGLKYTFSAEIPYGIEDHRVMKTAIPLYNALRNFMPDPYLREINRGYKDLPGSFHDMEYVQWQRGPLSKTPVSLMKSWIDTVMSNSNVWLVLVFHGIDRVGWEPISRDIIKEYFDYIKSKDEHLWVATFGDVARYVRERMNSAVRRGFTVDGKIKVDLSHDLNPDFYNLDLTLKTSIPAEWKLVTVSQDGKEKNIESRQEDGKNYIVYQATPNSGTIYLSNASY